MEKGSKRCCSTVDITEIKVLDIPDKFKIPELKENPNKHRFEMGRFIDDNIKYLFKIVDMLPDPPKILLCKPSDLDY